jgi:hypothetical protein
MTRTGDVRPTVVHRQAHHCRSSPSRRSAPRRYPAGVTGLGSGAHLDPRPPGTGDRHGYRAPLIRAVAQPARGVAAPAPGASRCRHAAAVLEGGGDVTEPKPTRHGGRLEMAREIDAASDLTPEGWIPRVSHVRGGDPTGARPAGAHLAERESSEYRVRRQLRHRTRPSCSDTVTPPNDRVRLRLPKP